MRPPHGDRHVSRRVVLGGVAAGGVALTSGMAAGCSVDLSRVDPRSDPPTPTTTTTLRDPAPTDQDADLRTLEAVYAAVLSTTALVEAVSETHPRLRPILAPVQAMHRAHAEALAGAAPEAPSAETPRTRSPQRAARALALVDSTEATTQTSLFDWAMEARSGTFARLLGSMSAAIGQQRAVLPDRVPGAGEPS